MIVKGKWYTFTRRHSLQLKQNTRVKALEVPYTWLGKDRVMVWPMGPARTEDEAGISVLVADLEGEGDSCAHRAATVVSTDGCG